MDSLVFWLIFCSSSIVVTASCPKVLICFAFSFKVVISLEVSSIILPMEITFSVALWVSCAWLPAPCAISSTARSIWLICSILAEVFSFNTSLLPSNSLLLSIISVITLVRSCFSFWTARLIWPISSLRFADLLSSSTLSLPAATCSSAPVPQVRPFAILLTTAIVVPVNSIINKSIIPAIRLIILLISVLASVCDIPEKTIPTTWPSSVTGT